METDQTHQTPQLMSMIYVNCHVKCHDAISSTSMHDAENKTYTHAKYQAIIVNGAIK